MSTPSTKRRIGRFHVVVLQWTSKKRTKKCDARAEQLFCSENQSLLKVLNTAWAARVSVRCSFCHSVESVLYSVFIWRHGDHIGVPKPWNGGHVGVPNKSCGSWTLFLCKQYLLFQQICIDAGHVSENVLYSRTFTNGQLSTTVTSLQRSPLYNGHLSTTVTSLQR